VVPLEFFEAVDKPFNDAYDGNKPFVDNGLE
jgi:hypothetical protein